MSLPNPIVLLDARARYVHPAFQMTRASTKTVFDATGRLVTVPANAIGWDHDPATGQARGYLVEPSATNLILHSNDLSDGAWFLNNSPTVTPNAIVGPDGAGMARVERTASGATSIFQVPTIVAGELVCGSFIAKAGEITAVEIRVGPSGGHMRYAVSLIDGSTVLSPTTGGANAGEVEIAGYGVEYLGGGFWRPWIAGTLASGTTSATTHALLWQGGVGDGVYIGYVQTEVGSHPTSYIETGGATATRSAEQLVLADPADYPWWSQDAGTLVLDYVNWQKIGNSIYWQVGALHLTEALAGDLRVSGAALESDRGVISAQNYLPRRRYVVAVSWDGEIMRASANGAAAVSRGMTANPTGVLRLGWSSWASSPRANFARAVYYPARLSNADLQSLTAIQE